VSLLQFAHNVSYAVGPIVLGIAAKYLGYAKTFQAVGIGVMVTALISFLITPRKIKMPQKEIKREVTEIKAMGTKAAKI
jgi:uncharacterized membrane protein